MKVFIVEEDAALAASLTRQFVATGWQVTVVRGADAVGAASVADRPDVVLIDSVVGGVEVLERVRDELPEALMAVMGGEAVEGHGAWVVLEKPLRPKSLLALKKLVESRRAAPRVLISDDDELMIRSLSRAARHEGLDPVCETDAAQVVGLAKEVSPQVIVLDVQQRAMDGRDVLAKLKSDPATKDIKVVMLTGVEDQLTRHDCLILGAEDYVVKPLDPLFFVRIARKIAEAQMG